MFRLIGGIVGLIALTFVIIGVFKFQDADFRDELVYKYNDSKTKFTQGYAIVAHDAHEELFPSRKRPTVSMKQEDELKMFVPLFKQFGNSEWREFWEYIYGGYYQGEGWLKYKTYHTPSEIQEWLKKRYEQPFANFGQPQWNYFWQVLSEDKQIKQMLSGGDTTNIF